MNTSLLSVTHQCPSQPDKAVADTFSTENEAMDVFQRWCWNWTSIVLRVVAILQVQNGQTWCFHNVTTGRSQQTTTTSSCNPPLEYNCQLVNDPPSVYNQVSGPMYLCSIPGNSPGQSPTASNSQAGTPLQDKNYQGVFQPNYTFGAPSPQGQIQYAKTPVLQAGQVRNTAS